MRFFLTGPFAVAAAALAMTAAAEHSAPAAAAPAAAADSAVSGGPSGDVPPVVRRTDAPPPRFRGIPDDRREYMEKLERMKRERDAAQLGAAEARAAATGRRETLLGENPEMKELVGKIESLQAELAAATNALEALLRADESLVSLSEEADKAEEKARKSQWDLQEEIARAVRERQRHARIPDFSSLEGGNAVEPGSPAVEPDADQASTNAVRRRPAPPRVFDAPSPFPNRSGNIPVVRPEARGPGETAPVAP